MSSGIEPETRDFLKRIIQTISMGLLFLLLHMTFGLYFNWAFFEGTIRTGNIIYYIILLISLAALVYYYYRLWKGKI
jgi:NADH:ubiquinone oxidoreductase subunit 3 (subunit A)